MKDPLARTLSGSRQRGAASLVVVMVLFFVVSLAAAYASRNLIFEQKTAANQARSTLAFEAADAGVEWALAQLNGGVINNSCGDATPTTSFQQRYVAIAANGNLSQNIRSTQIAGDWWPTCVFDGAQWSCSCPNASAATLTAATSGSGPFPAFRVWVATPEATAPTSSPWVAPTVPRPGLMPLISVGCSRLPAASSDTCLDYLPRSDIGEGLSSVHVMLALRSGLAVPPAAAVTARMGVAPATLAPKLRVVNADTGSGGFTVNAGILFTAADKGLFDVHSVPGTPAEQSFADDDKKLDALSITAPTTTPPAPPALTAGERMFVSILGMKRDTYRQQPGLRRCPSPPSTTCTAADINALLAQNPGRIIWVDGNLTLDADIGVLAPVLLVIDGTSLTLGNDVDITGFVYITGRTPPAGAASAVTVNLPNTPTSITGALVSETSLLTSYTSAPAATDELSVIYSPAVLNTLRIGYGSWVRLGGGWRDFKANP
ncbi:MAG: PilX N-terminal domain-containing pilus assembly protein [Rubrivivax sp.]|nr:PilX N-terminal domain-containing pilus assembly protein [Rubrivivax sp.]